MKNINHKKIKEGQSVWKGLLFKGKKCLGVAPTIEKKYPKQKEMKLTKEEEMQIEYEAKIHYERKEFPKVREVIKELKAEIGGNFAKKRRLEYLNIRVLILTRISKEMEEDWERRTELDQPSWFKNLIFELERYRSLIAKIKNWNYDKINL